MYYHQNGKILEAHFCHNLIKWEDPSWEHINRSQIHECGNWERDRAVSFLGIFGLNFRYSVLQCISCEFLFSILLYFKGTGINFLLIGGFLVGVHEETIFKVHNWIFKMGNNMLCQTFLIRKVRSRI